MYSLFFDFICVCMYVNSLHIFFLPFNCKLSPITTLYCNEYFLFILDFLFAFFFVLKQQCQQIENVRKFVPMNLGKKIFLTESNWFYSICSAGLVEMAKINFFHFHSHSHSHSHSFFDYVIGVNVFFLLFWLHDLNKIVALIFGN